MGVELGKILTKNILTPLDKPADIKGHTSSVRYFLCSTASAVGPSRLLRADNYRVRTSGLIRYYWKHRNE